MAPRHPPNNRDRSLGDIDRPTAETLAAVEHDFYDALAVIIARTQLLSRRLTGGKAEPAEVVEGLATIERAARRMVGGVGRLSGGDQPSPPKP